VGYLDGGSAAGNRTVAAKTEHQQAMLGLHRMRSLLIKSRTMRVNQLQGLLYEFGVSFRTGRVAGLNEIRSTTVATPSLVRPNFS
jgi:transposase